MSPTEPNPNLTAQFDALQQNLVPLWEFIGKPTQEEHTIVVVPSLSLDSEFHGSEQQAYEERFLFMLFLLQQPRVRMVYVTSMQISPTIVDYYLDLLPGVVASHARKRLFLVAPQDSSSLPLTLKLLDRPRLLREIRELVRDPNRALVPYNTTDLERELSVRLGIPMYAADPRFFAFGTKSGCRRIFAEEGVQHPLGIENLYTQDDLINAVQQMRSTKPGMKKVILKLNDEVSGQGNAVLDLTGLEEGVPDRAGIEDKLHDLKFELSTLKYDEYLAKFVKRGGIAEEYITGTRLLSPSAQMRNTPLGQVGLLSTHDQILGGPSGQSYLGCRFPANVEYGPAIMREAEKVGKRFAREGIVGRYAIDFVVVKNDKGKWDPYAIEVNLRKGGTTHPFLTLQYLTDGKYHANVGEFRTVRGASKCYVATDHMESHSYRALTPDDLFDVVSKNRLHFNHTTQKGVVLHMMSALGDRGRFGFTAIGDSQQEADAFYARTVELVDAQAKAALAA